MMDDLISRSALKAYIQANGMVYANTLDTFPTVDPVKHGRWIISSDGYYPYCSECGTEPKERTMTKFCSECGCKMDGDDKP